MVSGLDTSIDKCINKRYWYGYNPTDTHPYSTVTGEGSSNHVEFHTISKIDMNGAAAVLSFSVGFIILLSSLLSSSDDMMPSDLELGRVANNVQELLYTASDVSHDRCVKVLMARAKVLSHRAGSVCFPTQRSGRMA